jgi:hypothetical protein
MSIRQDFKYQFGYLMSIWKLYVELTRFEVSRKPASSKLYRYVPTSTGNFRAGVTTHSTDSLLSVVPVVINNRAVGAWLECSSRSFLREQVPGFLEHRSFYVTFSVLWSVITCTYVSYSTVLRTQETLLSLDYVLGRYQVPGTRSTVHRTVRTILTNYSE